MADQLKAKKNFKKVFGKRKSFLPLQPATEVTTEGKEIERERLEKEI